MGLRKRPGQISLEYLLIIGFTFAIIIPGIYFFQAYSQSSVSGFGTAQYDKLGNEIVGTAVQTLAQGKGSWLTLDLLVPESVLNITVDDQGRELVITYLGPFGPTEAVFFSDDVAIRNKDASDGSIYSSGVHGGRLTLKFVAGSNNNVSIEEDTGWWTQPVEYCENDDECLQHSRDDTDCYHRAFCDNEVCTFDIPPDPDSLGSFGGCDGNFRYPGGVQCIFNLSVEPDCTDDGWDCPYSTQTVNCRTPGLVVLRDGDTPLCWHRLPEVSGSAFCNATGCHVNADDGWRCADSDCNATFGWNNTLCIGDRPYIYSIYLNATDSPVNSSDANLTAWPNGIVNPNDGHFSILYDWRVNDESIAVVNMHFDVNESAGENKTRDYSTWENHGEVFGARWNATGGWNKSGGYEFDGEHTDADGPDHIIIPGDDLSTTGQQFTVSFWFSPDGLIDSSHRENMTLVEKRELTGDWQIHFLTSDAGMLRWRSYVGNVRTQRTSWEPGEWYHITTVYENNTEARIYVNGIEDNRPSAPPNYNIGVLTQSTDDIFLGTRFDNSHRFKGSMDEFKIYKRALSSREVLALYENKTWTLDSLQTRGGDTWQVCGTPSDGIYNGSTTCSNELFIKNNPPVINSLLLQASDHPANSSDADLTAIPDVIDPDGYPVHILYDWRLGGTSIAVVNMGFDVEHGSNNQTKDYSTYHNNGTIGDGSDTDTMPTWNKTGGWNGTGAYMFDDNDYIAIPGDDLSTAPFSISFWFKPNTTINAAPPEIYNIFEKDDDGNRANGFQIFFTADAGRMRFHSYSGAIWTNTALWENDIWYHVVAVYDGGTGSDFIYVNGVLDNYNNDYTLENLNMNAEDFVLGNNPNRPLEYGLPATFDNVQVFKHALSNKQVAALYDNRTDYLRREETSTGDVWSVCGTPNDGHDDGAEVCSNDVPIAKHPCKNNDFGMQYAYCREMSISYMSLATLNDYQVEVDLSSLHPGLLGSWHFNEGSGTVAKDSSGNGHDGTLTNSPTWTTSGVEGDSLSFVGPTLRYVDIGDDAAFQQNRYTVSAWVNIPSTIYETQTVVGRRDAWDETNYMVRIVSSTGRPQITHVRPDIGNTIDSVTGTTDLRNAGWKHVVATYDGSEQRIYVNGVSEGFVAAADPEMGGGQQVQIGHDRSGNFRFDGDIDEVRIYDRALSEDEVKTEFCTGASKLNIPTLFCVDYFKSHSYIGADYRFTDLDGAIRFPHWLEHDNKAWVKIPTISPLAGIPPFYFYYGLKDATDLSDGDATFILFDDFNDGVVDLGKWTPTTTIGGTITESNGIIDVNDGTVGAVAELTSVISVSEPVIVERILQFPTQTTTSRNRFGPRRSDLDSGIFFSPLRPHWLFGPVPFVTVPLNTQLEMENIFQGTTFMWNVRNLETDTQIFSLSTIGGTHYGKISTNGGTDGYARVQMDRILARVYASPGTEPTVAIGEEN
ncbi:DUF2341 domain-containing protein [Candidatus Woesearchaeota archaeon]|nr:DUF2341 domain-containing protein [Candidatus Woesearchaeota archaeon]